MKRLGILTGGLAVPDEFDHMWRAEVSCANNRAVAIG